MPGTEERSREFYCNCTHCITVNLCNRIIEKLEGLGWGDEIEELNEYNPIIFSRHPIVNQPKDLTDRSAYNHRDFTI